MIPFIDVADAVVKKFSSEFGLTKLNRRYKVCIRCRDRKKKRPVVSVSNSESNNNTVSDEANNNTNTISNEGVNTSEPPGDIIDSLVELVNMLGETSSNSDVESEHKGESNFVDELRIAEFHRCIDNDLELEKI